MARSPRAKWSESLAALTLREHHSAACENPRELETDTGGNSGNGEAA